jgi:hypothetical protein
MTIVVKCPHCDEYITVEEKDLNCRIFRHAVYRHNMQPIHPHASKQTCQDLIQSGSIWGCGGPFKIINKNGEEIAEICDYI